MENFRVLGKIGEGTFSEVLKIQSLIDGKHYACKRMKQRYESVEQVNNLREVQALRRLSSHPHILELKQVLFDPRSGVLSLICELLDMNAYELIKDRRSHLPEQKTKLFTYQLCKALYHLHRNGIFHRDVKPENILIRGDVVKLADFGSCRTIYSQQPYTEYISTRWYRAPECLLTDGYYGYKMDLWSVGCVLFELTTDQALVKGLFVPTNLIISAIVSRMRLQPLFPGSNELDQIARIHNTLGTPSKEILDKFKKYQSRSMTFNFSPKTGTGISSYLKHSTRSCGDIILRLCAYDPDERFTAKQALRHPYFAELREAEIRVLRARQDQSISEMSSLRGSAMAGPLNRRQHQILQEGSVGRNLPQLMPHARQDGMTEVQRIKHNDQQHSEKQSILPALVAKSPHAVEPGGGPQGGGFKMNKLSTFGGIPGIQHHQKTKHQMPAAGGGKIGKTIHRKPSKPHFLQPLQKNQRY